MKGLPLLAVCTSIGALFATEASAAMQAPCAPAAMRPSVPSIPANLPAFGYTALDAKAEDVHLFSTSGTKVEVPLTVGPVVDGYLKVAPTAPLTVGGSYELTFQAFCSYGAFPAPGPVVFTVASAAPLPTTLGAVLSLPQATVSDFGTSKYTITTSYALANEMKPWGAVYTLGIMFDGKPIETKLSAPAADGSVQIVATGWCDEATAARTKHDVVLRARLPFAPTLETPVSSLEFSCPAPNIVTPKPSAPSARTPSPTGTTPTGNNSSSTSSSSSNGGCSAAPGAGSGASLSLIAIAALGAASWVRRRRSPRNTYRGEA